MTAFSNYLESKIVEHFLQNSSVASPATVYLGLFETDPGEGTLSGDPAANSETGYNGYDRQECVWTSIDSNGETKNNSAIAFPPNANTSASVTIGYAAIFDAENGGNMLLYGELAAQKTLAVGDVLSFQSNSLTLTLN